MFYDGEDDDDNKAFVCRLCHHNLHAGDVTMKRQGWLALAHKLGQENVSEYMRTLAKRKVEKQLKLLGQEGISQEMSRIARMRWER